MKKWHSVLWIVLAAIALTAGVGIFKRPSTDITIGVVNGQKISMKTYRQALSEISMQIEMYKAYAKMYGIPAEMFLNMAGLNNPDQAAFDQCVRNTLIDSEKNKFNVKLDPEYVAQEIAKSLPMQVKDAQGNLDIQAYRFYLSRLGTTITDFEQNIENSIERSFFENFVKESAYISVDSLKNLFIQEHLKKNFEILELNFDHFLKEAKEQKVDSDVLKKFFAEHKEVYRIPEKRKINYWIISPTKYAEKINIDQQMIEEFYEKNKSSLFRVPPKVKVRHILFKFKENSTPEEIEQTLERAKDVHGQVVKAPEKFIEFIKKYSQDKDAAKDGLIDFFKKGTYEPEFEKVALSLKETGEISELIKTNNGYEIIQLVERKSAFEKALETVRDEIIKIIKSKKSLTNLKSDLEKTLYNAKKDKTAIEKFAKDNDFKMEQTGFLTKGKISENKLENILAEKVFGQNKSSVQGYFTHENNQILYQLSEVEPSFIPEFEKIEDQVLADYYKDKAKNKIKTEAKKLQLDLMQNKTSASNSKMQNLAKTLNFKLIQTGMLKKSDKEAIKKLNLEDNLIERAFILDDPRQVLRFKGDLNIYLVRLKDVEKFELSDFENAKSNLLQSEKMNIKNQYLESFIASLRRNAKIEKVQKMLNVNNHIDYIDMDI
ncbi:peptidylprolyl isomerase [Candidatus Babeliales bacterium]|nr:peptidylprolyl isomerase [Candidatus Babeliales bacterium]MCF7899424.1 peptidylprolyl isomerase [Candidatus Babeliales bacterium]